MQNKIAQSYSSGTYGREKCIAFSWLLVLVILVSGALYQRLGQPALDITTPAEAAEVAQ
jgi:hypothetical protein